MVALDASDLHFAAGQVPHARVDGELVPTDAPSLSAAELRLALLDVMPRAAQNALELTHDAEFVIEVPELGRFRAQAFIDGNGIAAALRRIPAELSSPEQLSLPEQLAELCWHDRGLVLVSGPAGSGKSTTLAAMVDFINHNRSGHIVTIEDPIEIVQRSDKCLVHQRQIGTHAVSFERALRAVRREDPDIVVVDELRDASSIQLVLEAADDGRLVLGSLRARSATSAIERLIEPFSGGLRAQLRAMMADSLRGVVVQTLCRRVGGGRTPAFEILLGTPAVSKLVRDAQADELVQVMQLGAAEGMCTLNQHLVELVRSGMVEPAEAYLKSNDPLAMKEQLAELGISLPSRTGG